MTSGTLLAVAVAVALLANGLITYTAMRIALIQVDELRVRAEAEKEKVLEKGRRSG